MCFSKQVKNLGNSTTDIRDISFMSGRWRKEGNKKDNSQSHLFWSEWICITIVPAEIVLKTRIRQERTFSRNELISSTINRAKRGIIFGCKTALVWLKNYDTCSYKRPKQLPQHQWINLVSQIDLRQQIFSQIGDLLNASTKQAMFS